MTSKTLQMPSIFSVQRGLILSDAEMFNLIPGRGETPIQVIRHGIRGTQNQETLLKGGEKKVPNPQRTESAKTDPAATGMAVRFALSTINMKEAVFACNDSEFRENIDGFLLRFSGHEGSAEIQEVCNRYARNILNGRWLWRNRILGQKIRVSVTPAHDKDNPVVNEDAARRPHDRFGDYNESEQRLGEMLKDSLTNRPAQFSVEAVLDFGMTGSFEVFPSQNYVNKKPDGFARSLYKINRLNRKDLLRAVQKDDADTYTGDIVHMGDAAIRDQKVGNAIRTIDTWYDGGDEAAPIPVEPLGANLESNEFKRANKNGLYDLLCNIKSFNPAPEGGDLNREAMFILANMVRGFLAGKSKGDNEGSGRGKKPRKKGKSGQGVGADKPENGGVDEE